MGAKRSEPEMDKERPLTAEEIKKVQELVEGTNKEGIKALRAVIRKAEKKKYKPKGVHVRGYIDKDHAPYLDLVISYLYDNKLIKQLKMYDFTQYACHQVIDVVVEIIEEMQRRKGIQGIELSVRQPNVQSRSDIKNWGLYW